MLCLQHDRNGELKEYLVSGVTKEQFTSRIIRALETSPSVASNTTTSPSSSLPIQSSPAVQDLLAERRARLDVHKKEQEAREKAKKEAEARKRREEFEAAAAKDPKPSADAKHAVQIKKQQQQARDDRARILKRVEDDKAERREREAERKRQVAATKSLEDVAKPGVMESSTKRSSSECALQIRLFDGSTIRSRFPSHGSLSTHVRPWIKEKQEGDTPFNFKQVLTPLPNKTIETSEEEKSLQSLGLTPNATLILVPISTYTSAYQPSNIISSSLSTGYGLLSSGFGAVGGLLGSVLGGGATTPTEDQRNHGTSSGSGSTTLRTAKVEKHDQDNRQYYNGNSVSLYCTQN